MPNNPNPIESTQPLTREDLRAIGHGILRGVDRGARIYQDSPPEAVLGAMLRICTCHAEDSLQILTRERLVLPGEPATAVEVDLLLRRTDRHAVGVVEVEGWRWHRRTPDEHEREIRRDRLLRQHCVHVVRYSAGEVLRDPWGTVLDVIRVVHSWIGFDDIGMSAGMRMVAEACAAVCPTSDPETGSAPNASGPLSLLDRLREVAAELPPPPPTNDSALRRIRQDFRRMYASWEDAEVEAVRDAFRGRVDVEDIACALGRTESAVWAQLRRMGIIA